MKLILTVDVIYNKTKGTEYQGQAFPPIYAGTDLDTVAWLITSISKTATNSMITGEMMMDYKIREAQKKFKWHQHAGNLKRSCG